MSMPFCLISLARSPIKMEVLLASTASANNALGFNDLFSSCNTSIFSVEIQEHV